jgi:hypothetical protein
LDKEEITMNTKKTNKTSVFIMRMCDEKKDKIKKIANDLGYSLTEFADMAFEEFIKNHETQKQG